MLSWHSDEGKIPLFLTLFSWDHKVACRGTTKDQPRSSCLSYTLSKCAPPKNPGLFPVLSPALVLLGCSGLVYLEIVFVSCSVNVSPLEGLSIQLSFKKWNLLDCFLGLSFDTAWSLVGSEWLEVLQGWEILNHPLCKIPPSLGLS